VICAIAALNNARLQRLHEYERPFAMLAAQQAEMNRDRKKHKKPYQMDEFYLYKEAGSKSELPEARYGAAAKALIEQSKFPSWALFIYKDLIKNAVNTRVPDEIAYISSECIILAPEYHDSRHYGMIIGLHSASNKILDFSTTDGTIIQIWVPELPNKVTAIEEAEFKVLA